MFLSSLRRTQAILYSYIILLSLKIIQAHPIPFKDLRLPLPHTPFHAKPENKSPFVSFAHVPQLTVHARFSDAAADKMAHLPADGFFLALRLWGSDQFGILGS